MEAIADRITLSPDLCIGKPTIRGMRITVNTVLEHLSAGDTAETILEHYPFLEQADIEACLKFAANLPNRNLNINSVR